MNPIAGPNPNPNPSPSPYRNPNPSQVGAAQLAWLRRELDASAAASEQVILVVHQLLVAPPSDGRAALPKALPSAATQLPAPG